MMSSGVCQEINHGILASCGVLSGNKPWYLGVLWCVLSGNNHHSMRRLQSRMKRCARKYILFIIFPNQLM